MPADPGQRFGEDLILLEKLAAGGMAEVFRARQTGIGGFEKIVAVKRILPHLAADQHFKEMFQTEVNLSARFQHPNIVQVFRTGETEGWLYLVMEFVAGKSLAELMRTLVKQKRSMPIAIACHLIAEAAKGLDYAHAFKSEAGTPLNVVHRDISPQNIMVSYDGQVKIVDFGIAKAADRAEFTETGFIKGKAAYMAPEQARGDPLDNRTDVFALGVVLWELIAGQRLFKGDSQGETLRRVRECAVLPPSSVNKHVQEALDRIVLKALAPSAGDRYATARDLYRDLVRHLQHGHSEFVPTDLEDFVHQAFANEISAELKKQKDLSSDLPTTHLTPGGKTPAQTKSAGSKEIPWTGSGIRRSSSLSIIPAPQTKPASKMWMIVLGAIAAVSTAVFLIARREPPIEPIMPSVIPGLVGWWRAETITAEPDADLEAWRDSGPLGFDLVQPEAKARPKFSRGLLNGLPVVTFDGNSDFMVADKAAVAVRTSQAITVITVARARADKTHFLWAIHASNRHTDVARAGFALGEKLRVKGTATTGGQYSDSERVAILGFAVNSVVVTKNSIALWVDGKKKISDSLPMAINFYDSTFFTIGMEWDEEGPTDFLDGDIAELMIFERELTDRERRSLEAYLVKKYGIVVF